MEIKQEGKYRYLYASEGKILVVNNQKVFKMLIPNGKEYSDYDFIEIDDADYVPPEVNIEDPEDILSTIRQNQIALSKLNLSAYLEANPLFSTVKYEDGRYYTVTTEKQQQLTSKILMYQGYQAMGMGYELTWNDSGNVCEPWTFEELFRLSCEIDIYVTPLVKMQQSIEVLIKNAETQEEVLDIDVSYSEENIEKYINI